MNKTQPKRALISVSDKTGIVDFSKKLAESGVEIVSTGGTAKILKQAGLKVVEISEFTGFPEMMDGRVKTLHPKVHGGILALRDNEKHLSQAKQHQIKFIDLVAVNLYPFEKTARKPGVKFEEVIENIDIGGPSMVRSAAKNFKFVGIVVDPRDYASVIKEIQGGGLSYETREKLSQKAFGHTANYDAVIYNYLSDGKQKFPAVFNLHYHKITDLRYGENPHQQAAFYTEQVPDKCSIVRAKQLQGKELSYNNINDADGALTIAREFNEPAVAVIKHANPCGAAAAKNIDLAFKRAYAGDSLSAFGGIIAMNRKCTAGIARFLDKVFAEVVIAPSYEPAALKIFAKKPALRLLRVDKIKPLKNGVEWKKVAGGLLAQDIDVKEIKEKNLRVISKKKPTTKQIKDLLFAWKIIKHVKSNAILIAKDQMVLGVGAGQMSRVDSTQIAVRKAGQRIKGAVLASDAFFPFRDSIDAIAKTGVKAIIQPGGSKRDSEVIKAVDENGLAMVFTGTRCFKH